MLASSEVAEVNNIGKLRDLQKEIKFESYGMDMKLVAVNPNVLVTSEGKNNDYIKFPYCCWIIIGLIFLSYDEKGRRVKQKAKFKLDLCKTCSKYD